jgi:chromosome segregation ATPase
VEARDNLKKELLDVYKKFESTTQELVDERRIVTTLNRELEALAKQLQVDSQARRALEADLDEATRSLDEMNTSALSLSKALETTHSKNATLEAEKEMLSKALDEQQKITTMAQENSEDAQNLITRLQTEKETFEMRSRHLEEELALAKGEMLRLRRQISASKSQKTRILPRTSAPTETSTVSGTSSPTETSTVSGTSSPTESSQQALNEQPGNDRDEKTVRVAAGTPYTVKRTTRRRKGGA